MDEMETAGIFWHNFLAIVPTILFGSWKDRFQEKMKKTELIRINLLETLLKT